MRRSVVFAIALGLAIAVDFQPRSLQADQPVAQIKNASGTGTVTRGSRTLAVEPGVELYEKDRIQTGTDSSLGITFRDGTQVSLGENSDFAVEEFAFEPQKGVLSFIMSLMQGSLVYVSGRIAVLAPETVRIRTVNGTVGVRGTRFAARVPGSVP